MAWCWPRQTPSTRRARRPASAAVPSPSRCPWTRFDRSGSKIYVVVVMDDIKSHSTTKAVINYSTRKEAAHGASQLAQAEAAVLDLLATSRPGARTAVRLDACIATSCRRRCCTGAARSWPMLRNQASSTWYLQWNDLVRCRSTTLADALRPGGAERRKI